MPTVVRESGHKYHRRSEVTMQGDAALAHAQHMGMLPPPRMSGAMIGAHAHAHANVGVTAHAHAHAQAYAHAGADMIPQRPSAMDAHAHAYAHAHAHAGGVIPQRPSTPMMLVPEAAGGYHAFERKSKVKVKVSGVVEDPSAMMMMPPARHSAVPMYSAPAPVAPMPMPQQRHSAVVMAGAHAHAHAHAGAAVAAPMGRPSQQVMVPMKVRESKTKVKAKTKTKERTVMVPMNIP